MLMVHAQLDKHYEVHEMENIIKIWHGIYDIFNDVIFNRVGFFHEETQTILKMNYKLQTYLYNKGMKMGLKYSYKYLEFTLGRDDDNDIEAIAIVHPHHDLFSEIIGEAIVIGRIKRMRGDIRTPYNLSKRHRVKNRDGTIVAGDLVHPYTCIK